MNKEENNIPPTIQDWIQNLFHPNMPLNIRENYRDNLERVARVATEAVAKFDRERNRNKPHLVK